MDPSNSSNQDDEFGDEFDDDDLDLDLLMEAVETAEKQHAAPTPTPTESRSISFVSEEPDPTPPPPLPASTPCPHKFDPENLRTWIYPINYPIRGYQLNIVRKALFKNTLVALPTGLGKTFIAAVVMYNYYRWFPDSIILFMAPTRPLVEQQIEACHKICGLDDTTLLMGTTAAAKRTPLWQKNRVFFATPQTIEKDIDSRQFPLEKVVCVVVDEAHRATGNFAYSVVIRKLAKKNKHFRVLALTATPGSTLDAVQEVITNLHITHIQIRTEDSMDIREFSHGKNIQNITVRLDYSEGATGLIPKIISDYKTKVFQPLLDDLARKPSGVQMDADQATPYGLRSRRLYFMATAKNINNGLKFSIFQSLLMAETLCRAYERLCIHGVGSFVETIENKLDEIKKEEESGKKVKKSEEAFRSNQQLKSILTTAKRAMQNPEFAGHPKIERMVSILINHFSSLAEGEASKVMVFSSYRSSVTEICKVLDRHRPIIRCSPFVGQAQDKKGAKGLNQREQQEVIQKFKKDEINVIVATSIGEEGLDIGEVDLIICYDSESSPIRMLQRMGRTGRKRQGKCIMLLTPQEEKKYARAKDAYSKIQSLIARGCNLNYYGPNPTVLPANYKPTMSRQVLTVRPYVAPSTATKRKRGGNQPETDYTIEGTLKSDAERAFIESFRDFEGRQFTTLQEVKDYCWPTHRTMRSLSKYIPLQTRAKSTYRVGHAQRTLRFTGLIANMEDRILNPDNSTRLMISAAGNKGALGGSQLMLPSKSISLGADHLILPSKLKSSTKSPQSTRKSTAMANRPKTKIMQDEDVVDFLEQQNIGQIIGIENNDFEDSFSFSLPATDVEQPRRADPSTPLRNISKKDKGKAKITDSMIPNQGLDPEFDMEFEQEDFHSLSWEPMLPDELFVDNTSTGLYKARFEENNFSSSSPPLENGTTKEKKSLASLAPLPEPPPPPLTSTEGFSINGKSSDDEFDIFDDEIDMKLLEQLEAVIIPGFNDPLKPLFAFEMAPVKVVQNKPVMLWKSESMPRLSERGKQVFNKRQEDFKSHYGRFLSTCLLDSDSLAVDGIFKENNASHPSVSPVVQNKKNPVIVIDDSQSTCLDDRSKVNIPNLTAAQDESIRYPNTHDTRNTCSKSATITNISNAKTSADHQKETNAKQDEEDEFDDSFDLDLDEGLLANFLENRFDEDGQPAEFPDMLNFEPSQSIIVDKKKSLYYSETPTESSSKQTSNVLDASTTTTIRLEKQAMVPKDDIIFEFNFETDKFSDDEAEDNDIENGTILPEEDTNAHTKHSHHGSPGLTTERNDIVILDSDDDNSMGSTVENSTDKLTVQPRPDGSAAGTPLSSSKANEHSIMDLESSPIRLQPRKKRVIVNEDEESSLLSSPSRGDSSLLVQLAKGQQSPASLKAIVSDPESSPIIITRRNRKRPLIEALEDSQQISLSKQVKKSESVDNLSPVEPQRTQHRHKKRQRRYDSQFMRQFIDTEAERSSDAGHTTDADGDEGFSLMNSFIDDNSILLEDGSGLSLEEMETNDGKRRTNIYAKSLLQSPTAKNEKHWMNKFNADKWLNIDAADDSIIGSEEDDEQEEEVDLNESIEDFSSDNLQPTRAWQNIFEANDDDDFI